MSILCLIDLRKRKYSTPIHLVTIELSNIEIFYNSTKYNSVSPDERVGCCWWCWKTIKLSGWPGESSWAGAGGGQSREAEEGGQAEDPGRAHHHQQGGRRGWSPWDQRTLWAHCDRKCPRTAGRCWSNVFSSCHCICWRPAPVWPPWPLGERGQGRWRRRLWRSKTCLEERKSQDSAPRLKYKLIEPLSHALHCDIDIDQVLSILVLTSIPPFPPLKRLS